MSERVGFVTMGEAGGGDAGIPTLDVGMLGYAFMGKAHTNAYKTMDYIYTPPPARARLVAIAGRTQERVPAAAQRYGYEKAVRDWRGQVADAEGQVLKHCPRKHPSHQRCDA